MMKLLSFIYGIVCWVMFLLVFMYMIGFLGDFGVPKTVNSGEAGPLGQAVLIDLFLIALFGIHHSVAARPWFKELITRYTPKHLERSTYVLISNLLVVLILWQWRPIPAVVWDFQSDLIRVVLYSFFGLGWLLVVLASFLINHFDLLGVRHVYLNLIGKEYAPIPFKAQLLYKHIRNPLMLGWFTAFWSTPHMTVGHLVFAGGLTLYGLIGILYEERTHAKYLGAEYEEYRRKTPMIIPFRKK